ncbi:ABC transporter substrate-binding protein [Halorussus amylolyticus]|uniref:ABC transporter substrate-binding protein n=1 Tax=Halorussus amylolyticus TaxID=1126242 RepID=UPI00104B6DF3|nr:ABC transporter substrate-binding protein [Halorussus amylolyticus]
MAKNRKTDDTNDRQTNDSPLSRRRYLQASALAGTGGLTALAGCSGDSDDSSSGTSDDAEDVGDSSNDSSADDAEDAEADVPEGVPEEVETQYWNDWPTIDEEEPPMDYTASAGAALDTITMEFSSEAEPWMREHALMVQTAVQDLGASVDLTDRPLNQLYAESWTTQGLERMMSMSSHGPDPQRGLDPNPFLMRLQEENLSNYNNYWNPEMSEVLQEQAQLTGDQEARQELVNEAQEIYAEDVGDLITLFPDVITALNTNKFEGYVMTPGNGPTGDAFPWTEVNLQPKSGETTYVKGATSSMNSLNLPWAAGGIEEKRLTFIYDGLFDATPDLEVVPALATEAEFTDDTTVVFQLREGVQWHDGEDFTAEDVKFTVDLYNEYSATSQATFYEPIESAEVLGDHEVQFNLSDPDASFMTQRVVRSAIIPKHKWEDVDNPSQHNPDEPVGTGPFQFEDWDQGSRFEASRNDDHWMFDDDWRADVLGDQATSGDGIENVVWVNVGNVDALIGALQNDEIDATPTLSNEQAERAAATSGIEKRVAENFSPVAVKLMHSCPLIRDKEFRVALAKATDKEGFVSDVLQDRATVSPSENYISELTQWYHEDTQSYEYDVDEARAILERAGYTWDDDGNLRFPNGEAWGAFVERIQPENTHSRREELDQPDFS